MLAQTPFGGHQNSVGIHVHHALLTSKFRSPNCQIAQSVPSSRRKGRAPRGRAALLSGTLHASVSIFIILFVKGVQRAVGQNQWCHFGVGAPSILVYFSGAWVRHRSTDTERRLKPKKIRNNKPGSPCFRDPPRSPSACVFVRTLAEARFKNKTTLPVSAQYHYSPPNPAPPVSPVAASTVTPRRPSFASSRFPRCW